jgi:hypothetical protein
MQKAKMRKLHEETRGSARVYPGIQAHDLTVAEHGPHDIRAKVEQRLVDAGLKVVVYDGEARAYTSCETPPREEPVLLTNWRGTEGGGTRVILRGQGEIQQMVEDQIAQIGEFEPDEPTEETQNQEDVRVFTFVEKRTG